MSCVVYQTNKKSGYVYAYESTSYRDPVTRMPKSKRTFIGRVDPITKELLDPEKAERLRERRNHTVESQTNQSKRVSQPDLAPDSTDESGEILAEIRDIKALILRQHDEFAKMQKAVETSEKVYFALASVFQDPASAR